MIKSNPKSKIVVVHHKLLDVKAGTMDVLNRMHRLDDEYHRKRESLRELYLDARSKEVKVINQIIKISQGYCQK